MRTYRNSLKEKFSFFVKLNLKEKIKFCLRLIGLKFLISKTLFFFLKKLVQSKNYFLRGLYFDTLINNKLLITKNDKNEVFTVFANDKVISKETFVKGEFDFKKFENTLNFIKQKKKIENLYDIGANIGTICIPAVKRNLIKKAFAVEPEINNYKLLKANIILNDLEKKIKTFNFALSDKENTNCKMEISEENAGDHRILDKTKFNFHEEEKREIVDVETKKFDSIFNDLSSGKDLVWIDTQGHEANVLLGAQNLIKNKIPVVVEFWPYALKRNNSWDKMFKCLKKFDFLVDLSNEDLRLEKIDNNTLDKLKFGWDDEMKNKHSLFTDLILLKE